MHHMEEAPGGGVRLGGLDGATLELLAAAFRRRGMCAPGLSDGGLQLTESGRFVVQRCGEFGVAVSYWPMLRQLDAVLFGDVTEVFRHNDEGHEAHVDRTMNVIASGFMHGKFFDDMMSVHVHHTFDELPLDQQPSIVADTGCGDGTLLLRLYEYVRDYTLRGKHLENRPLLMVGVDFNGASLLATAETLGKAGVPFETMFGDIGDPETIHKGLCSRFGARDEDDVLHVRSFLDHDRPYLEPTDDGINASVLESENDAAYVHPNGGVLTRALAYSNLVEHMRRWASVAGRHGLLLLEAHSLTVSDTAEFMTEATSLHFDALQSWSGQMLVPAPHWQLALGHAGLLPDENWLCYPKGSPYTRITLQRLVPAPCAGFRLATLSDLPQLLELEEQWDAPFLRSSEATLRQIGRASCRERV